MLLNLNENDFFFLREAFCGLEYAENVFATGVLPRIPLEELTTLFETRPLSAGRGHPFKILTLLKKRDGIYRFSVRIWPQYAENAFVERQKINIVGSIVHAAELN